MIRLILNARVSNHVSDDAIKEFEKAILSDPQVKPANGDRGIDRLLGAFVWRLYERATIRPLSKLFVVSPFSDRNEYFAILMGIRPPRKCMPYFAFNKRKHLYLFDAWPEYHDDIREFVHLYKVRSLHVSSQQAAEQLRESCQCPVFWVPEGINPLDYFFFSQEKKDIDVIEFGRKHMSYHDSIKNVLKDSRKVHLYEKIRGEPIFKTRDAFIDGLARSKISICIPCNMTHPERSGDIETMTIRYLQSMLSKCLILGHAPKEMLEIFGYNPVVEIDHNDPCQQLLSLLNTYEEFVPLIERNYNLVIKNHTWDKRWETIKNTISSLP